mmetsp:Transcript_127526/g.346061  ORF Transcript_127526/g.346061 Transcript_127526/m.346061 type:complete len:247 (-) Transcript_127526:61-801(-)
MLVAVDQHQSRQQRLITIQRASSPHRDVLRLCVGKSLKRPCHVASARLFQRKELGGMNTLASDCSIIARASRSNDRGGGAGPPRPAPRPLPLPLPRPLPAASAAAARLRALQSTMSATSVALLSRSVDNVFCCFVISFSSSGLSNLAPSSTCRNSAAHSSGSTATRKATMLNTSSSVSPGRTFDIMKKSVSARVKFRGSGMSMRGASHRRRARSKSKKHMFAATVFSGSGSHVTMPRIAGGSPELG